MDYRNLFDGIDDKIKLSNGVLLTPINFDNGATTPPLKSVTQIIYDNIKNYGPIARGVGFKGEYCTTMFNKARDIILDFFCVLDNDDYTVIYTKSDTEGLNALANVLIQDKDDMVLTTRMEHHANDLPFRRVLGGRARPAQGAGQAAPVRAGQQAGGHDGVQLCL